MIKITKDNIPGSFCEEGTFFSWALFSIAFALEHSEEIYSNEDINKKAKNIILNLVEKIIGNRSDNYELTESDYIYLYRSIINWVNENAQIMED